MYLLVRDEVTVDRAIATTLRGARARSTFVQRPLQVAPLRSAVRGVRRRNPVERVLIRLVRPLARRPLGRLRSYLSEPMHARSTMIESRLERDLAVLASERRQLDAELIQIGEQLRAVREELAALRGELALPPTTPGRVRR